MGRLQARVDLTSEQRRAVRSKAHALVIRAGAGTGKTTTLAHRLARIAAEGAPEHRMLAVTFTREATASLHRRLGILLGKAHGVRVASFHQWAARELRSVEPRFLGQDEARRILLGALKKHATLGGAMGARGDELVGRVQGFLSYVRNAETTVGGAILRHFSNLAPHEAALEDVERCYQHKKGARLDYDDLLISFRDELARSQSFRREVAGRLDHIAVDEYQDVSKAQHEAVLALTTKRGAPDVTIVGDPRQSIYGFRGASPAHLDRFLDAYGRRAAQVALTVSFRSTRAIVGAGNRVIADPHPLRPRPRAEKGAAPLVLSFEDGAAEARAAADHVEALLARAQPNDIAVLCRSRPLASAYVEERDARPGDLARVQVTTIHAAKGLEWDHVVLLGAREGGLPSEQALRAPVDARAALLEEERRLMYVAVTRARKTLLVTHARAASRFLAALALGEKGMEEKTSARERALA